MNQQPQTILGIDPGLNRTGYAAIEDAGTPDLALIDAGILSPGRVGEQWDHIEILCVELSGILDTHQPDIVLVEWNSGKVNRRRHGGNGAGLAIHGEVTGALWREALYWARRRQGAKVIPVPENLWSRGVPKEARAMAVAQAFPINLDSDKGRDACDACGLCLWWAKERRIALLGGEAL